MALNGGYIPVPTKIEVFCFHLSNRLAKPEQQVQFAGQPLQHNYVPIYLGIALDRILCYKKHRKKTENTQQPHPKPLNRRGVPLRTSALTLVYSCTEYYAPVWLNGHHTRLIDLQLNQTTR